MKEEELKGTNFDEVENISELMEKNEFKLAFLEVLKEHFGEDKASIKEYYEILKKRLNGEIIEQDDISLFSNLLVNKDFIKIGNGYINNNIKCINFGKMKELFPSGGCEEIIKKLQKEAFTILDTKESAEVIKYKYVIIDNEFYEKVKIRIDGVDKYCFKKTENYNELKIDDFVFDSLIKIEIRGEKAINPIIIGTIGDKIGIIGDINNPKKSIISDKILIENLDSISEDNDIFKEKEGNFEGLIHGREKSIVLLNNKLYYIGKKDGKYGIIKAGSEELTVFTDEEITELKVVDNKLYYLSKIDKIKCENIYKDKYEYDIRFQEYGDGISKDSINVQSMESEIEIINGEPFLVSKNRYGGTSYYYPKNHFKIRYLAYGDDESKIIESPIESNLQNLIELNGMTYILIKENEKIGYINYETGNKIFTDISDSTHLRKGDLILKEDKNGVYLEYTGKIKKYFKKDKNEGKKQ